MNSGSRIRRRWTDKEDQVLSQEAESQLSHGILKDWNRVAAKLPGRTNKDCRKRWSKIGENVKKGTWDDSEDEKLRSAVRDYGHNWTQVALVLQTRNADQCAKRWQHSLDPNLDHSEWKNQDDDRLLAAASSYGRNWKTIKDREFPGRSATDIKNRHGIVLRRRRNSSGSTVYNQESLKISDPKQTVEHSLIQNCDDEEDSSSPSSNYDMFACEHNSVSVAPVARMGFGSDGTFPDIDEGTLLESLQPYDLTHQQQHRGPHTDIPMSGTYRPCLQDDFLNQSPVGIGDAFAFDYQWNEDAVALGAIDLAPGSVDTPSIRQTASEDSDSRTVLTLYNVESGTLNSILDTAFKSKTKVKMETYH